jgi:hypothetical protein
MINGNQAGQNEADFVIGGLNPGKDKTVEQNGETLPARHRGHDFLGLPGFGVDRRGVRMAGAIDVADVISPSGRSQKKRTGQQQKQS